MLRISSKNLWQIKKTQACLCPNFLKSSVCWLRTCLSLALNFVKNVWCLWWSSSYQRRNEDPRTLSLSAVCSDNKAGVRLQHRLLPCQTHHFHVLAAPGCNSGVASYPIAWAWRRAPGKYDTWVRTTKSMIQAESSSLTTLTAAYYSKIGLILHQESYCHGHTTNHFNWRHWNQIDGI